MDILAIYKELEEAHPGITEWESESIVHEYGIGALDIISTIINCATTLGPWENWRIFEKVAVVLNRREVIGDIVQELDPREATYAVYLLKKAFPDRQFNDEVSSFIGLWYKEGGLVVAHPEVSFIQPYLRLVRLTTEMEEVQRRYLEEISAYIDVMEKMKNPVTKEEVRA